MPYRFRKLYCEPGKQDSLSLELFLCVGRAVTERYHDLSDHQVCGYARFVIFSAGNVYMICFRKQKGGTAGALASEPCCALMESMDGHTMGLEGSMAAQ